MKSKQGLFIFGLIFLVATLLIPYVEGKEVYEQDTDIDLKVTCVNENTGGYCSSTATCNITIYNPDSTLIVSNALMDDNTAYYNYTLNATYSNQLGDYSGNILCIDGSNSQTQDFTFLITPSGKENTTAQGIIYAGTLFVSLILFILCIVIYFKIDGNNYLDFGGLLKVNFNKYIKYGMFFLAYLMLWITSFFAWSLAQNFLFIGFMSGLLRVIYISLTVLLVPFFLMTFLFALVKWLTDLKLHKLYERGLKPR